VSTARWIDETYVKTGQVRIVSKNLPVHGAQAVKAAEAALCAMDQGKFWEYHDRLLENLYLGDQSAATLAGLQSVAASLDMDATAFTACLKDGKYSQRVVDDAAEAQNRGVTGTPTFFVNDTAIVGAQPFNAFKQVIDAALSGS
jgi:protein-disulfide isomerase